ncbi:MAG: FUSC family protein [Microbacteriaceae bacterium]
MTAEGVGAARLQRLERSIRRTLDARIALERAWSSIPAIVQIVVAATSAYVFARYVVGHDIPIVAVTVTISALGFARDARPRRVLELVVGILVGLALAETLRLVVGTGIWQIAFVLFATLVVARFVSSSSAFAVAAGVQSMLAMVLPTPDGGVFVRSLDGLVGGAIALAVTALIPRDPRRIARRDSRVLLSTLKESLATVSDALRLGDEPAARLALERLRRTQELFDNWSATLDSAIAIARISPFLRKHLPTLQEHARVLAGLDMATRHIRLITRRIDFLLRDGRARPELGELISEIGVGVGILGEALDDRAKFAHAGDHFAACAQRLTPADVLPGAPVTDTILVHMMRPLTVDLLVASGLSRDDALATLPPM